MFSQCTLAFGTLTEHSLHFGSRPQVQAQSIALWVRPLSETVGKRFATDEGRRHMGSPARKEGGAFKDAPACAARLAPQRPRETRNVWQAIAIVEGALLLLVGLGLWVANRAVDEDRYW